MIVNITRALIQDKGITLWFDRNPFDLLPNIPYASPSDRTHSVADNRVFFRGVWDFDYLFEALNRYCYLRGKRAFSVAYGFEIRNHWKNPRLQIKKPLRNPYIPSFDGWGSFNVRTREFTPNVGFPWTAPKTILQKQRYRDLVQSCDTLKLEVAVKTAVPGRMGYGIIGVSTNSREPLEEQVTGFTFNVLIGNMAWYEAIGHVFRIAIAPLHANKIAKRSGYTTEVKHLHTVIHNPMLWDCPFDKLGNYFDPDVERRLLRKHLSWTHSYGYDMEEMRQHGLKTEYVSPARIAWNPEMNGQENDKILEDYQMMYSNSSYDFQT